MTINDQKLTAAEILALALKPKLNYWSNDGSAKWKSRLGTIIEIPHMGFKAMPNGCDFFAFFAVRKDAMDYVKENATFSIEPEETK